jgi:putative Holliday junction resolvase
MGTRVLGIDHGVARIGVAISDELRILAHPLETIDVRRTNPADRIASIAREKGVSDIVLGLPCNMDGSHGCAADKVRAFAKDLRKKIGYSVRVYYQDERLTTVSAARALYECGKSARDQKKGGIIDQVAAQLILQSWLDAQAPFSDISLPLR